MLKRKEHVGGFTSRQFLGDPIDLACGSINRGDRIPFTRERAQAEWEVRVLALAEPGRLVGYIASKAGCSLNQAAGALMRAGWKLYDGKCASFGAAL